ncbi:MAG: class I SAM-dependent methyltransferase [Methylacidiphilales bacterium]|nr:class I SAM-dependent methyltransferase [Candidatus Methylacidiphilales bacterium]
MINRLKLALQHYFKPNFPESSAPRAWRPVWLPSKLRLVSEAQVHPHVPEERAELFLAYNTGSTEIETLNWLYSMVCLIKPTHILETGAANGLGTLALASACRDNGFGCVHSVEIDPETAESLQETVLKNGLEKHVCVHCASSMDFLSSTDIIFDFGFFDSICEIRAQEYELCLKRSLLKGPAAFHDTSPLRTRSMRDYPSEELHIRYIKRLRELASDAGGCFEHRLGRGFVVIFPKMDLPQP